MHDPRTSRFREAGVPCCTFLVQRPWTPIPRGVIELVYGTAMLLKSGAYLFRKGLGSIYHFSSYYSVASSDALAYVHVASEPIQSH